jgi:hypothetical protein
MMCVAVSSGGWQMGQRASSAERIPFLRRDARERILACTSSHPKNHTMDDVMLLQTKETTGASTSSK